MKRQLKDILEELLEEAIKQNRLSEQIIRNQALLGCQNQRIHKTIISWWGTDLEHHGEENNLIKRFIKKNPTIPQKGDVKVCKPSTQEVNQRAI